MQSLISLSAAKMRAGLLQGQFSAFELVEAHLNRIRETQELNSFILVEDKQALAAAKKADEILAKAGQNSPLLTGIPVAIKDMLVTKGMETTCGSKILKGFIPPYECTAVARLRDAGAIIIGKTNMDEFAMGSSSETSFAGPVRNPYDTKRVSGGSSGGSAVAVSVGQAPLSLGTDTGGSIRQPAAFCGVLGLKPTYGRVSRYGAVAYASSCDQIGPFARSIEDLALALGIIAGKDENDSTSMEVEVPDYLGLIHGSSADLSGLRIGVPKEYFIPGMDSEVEGAVRRSLDTLAGLGAQIVDISLPHTEYALAAYYIIVPAEASSNLARYDGVKFGFRSERTSSLAEMYEATRAEGFGRTVKERILVGTYVLSAGYYEAFYHKAQQVRTLIIADFQAAFAEHCDVIAAPVSPSTAFLLGEKTDSPVQMYLADVFTVPLNLAGLPGLSLPCASDNNGLPIGMQLIAPPFSESTLLRVGDAFLRATDFDLCRMTQSPWPQGAC